MIHSYNIINVRPGCQDLWNAFMVNGATFSEHDIPFCPSTAISVPDALISFSNAKSIYKKELSIGNSQFHNNAFVHFCIDDQKFDGIKSGIWSNPYGALKILKHFSGVITPDFSTYADFPDPLKRWNTYRMRAFGLWLSQFQIPIINNVRWGDIETWDYCFDGLPTNSILFIGTVASGLRELSNRPLFDKGLLELIRRLHPHTLVIYGSTRYPIFNDIQKLGINIVAFPSDTSIAYGRGEQHE